MAFSQTSLMKVVYFIRHAKSSWDHPQMLDIDRPLNERGKRDAPFMAKLLKDRGVHPDAIVSSPANRAFTTAAYFAEISGIEKSDIQVIERIYEASSATIINVLQGLPVSWNTIFIFGHNPTFTDVVNQFAGRFIHNIPTCGIVKVEDNVSSWSDFGSSEAKVTEFYYPKQYFE